MVPFSCNCKLIHLARHEISAHSYIPAFSGIAESQCPTRTEGFLCSTSLAPAIEEGLIAVGPIKSGGGLRYN